MTTLTDRPHHTTVTRALWRKEWRENRAAAIAGVAIFLGLPAFGTWVFARTAKPVEVIGYIATVTLVAAGWLYAAVLGAQMVCRDFGRREGQFLLARPARVGQLVRAKLLVGIGHVGGLILIVWLWERLLPLLARPERYYGLPWNLPFAIGLTAGCLCAFLVAFAAAAITRQALSGVMLATLALVLLAALPFVTTRFTEVFFFPSQWQAWLTGRHANAAAVEYLKPDNAMTGREVGAGIVFLLSGAGLIGSAVLAYVLGLIAARSTRVPKLGTKTVAWAVAIVMGLVFTAAMREVGSNLRVNSMYFSERHGGTIQGSTALRAHRLAVMFDDSWRTADAALFDISEDGQVRSPRYAAVPLTTAELSYSSMPLVTFDDAARLYAVTQTQDVRRDANDVVARKPVAKLCRLWRIDWDAALAVLAGELALPATVAPADEIVPIDAACAAGQLHVLYVSGATFEQFTAVALGPQHILLATYALSDGTPPRLERSHDISNCYYADAGSPPPARFVRGADGRVYALTDRAEAFDPAEPNHPSARFPAGWGMEFLDSGVVIAPGVVAESTRWGFSVFAETVPRSNRPTAGKPRWRELGHVTPALLALSSRQSPCHLLSPRPGRACEILTDRAVCYDVSDPTHPRELAQVLTYEIQGAVADGDLLVLDHGAGFSVVKLPR